MMGANYRKGNQFNQGKRASQIAYSEMAVGVCILGILTTFIGFTLYHLISRLIHYIMG
jgi:hypothetical protein